MVGDEMGLLEIDCIVYLHIVIACEILWQY